MPDHPLRKILSGIVRTGAPEDVTITYIHRGATGDHMTIAASAVTNVRKGSFQLSDGETQIPFHRILQVENTKNGIIIWTKRTRAP